VTVTGHAPSRHDSAPRAAAKCGDDAKKHKK
jgi:hypothetical protein